MLLRKAARKQQPLNRNNDLAVVAGRNRWLLDTDSQASLKCPPLTIGLAIRRALFYSELAEAGPDFFSKSRVKAHGDSESISAQATCCKACQKHGTSARGQPAEAWRLHACLHHHTEEAELGDAEGRSRAFDERI